MDRQEELKKLRADARELNEKIEKLEASDWYDSGCTIDQDEADWEMSARHWSDEGEDWASSSVCW
jgi:hypothetical protein